MAPQPELKLPIGIETIMAFSNAKPMIIDRAVTEIMKNGPDLSHLGENAENIVRSGLSFTANALESIMVAGEKSLLEDQADWAKSRLPHDGIEPHHIKTNLEIMVSATRNTMDKKDADSIIPVIQFLITKLK